MWHVFSDESSFKYHHAILSEERVVNVRLLHILPIFPHDILIFKHTVKKHALEVIRKRMLKEADRDIDVFCRCGEYAICHRCDLPFVKRKRLLTNFQEHLSREQKLRGVIFFHILLSEQLVFGNSALIINIPSYGDTNDS